MKAKLLPLKGKYYGTYIEIERSGLTYGIELWENGIFEPSDRELDGECTIEQWRANDVLPNVINGWTGEKGVKAQEYIEICDSHFESRKTFDTAMAIIKAVNNA